MIPIHRINVGDRVVYGGNILEVTPLIYLHARQDLSRGEVNILLALSTLAGAPIFISCMCPNDEKFTRVIEIQE